MRKMNLILAGAASAVFVGGMVPAVASAAAPSTTGTAGTSSQVRDVRPAAEDCADKLPGRNGIGYVYATYNCIGKPICADDDNDANYASGGDCKGADNRSSSVLNKGFSGAASDIRFFQYKKYKGGELCLADGKYISKLKKANNKISSHKWGKC